MKALALALLALHVGTLPCSAAPASGLCAKEETTFFACRTSGQRWISLCGSPNVETLQYRFGRAGAVELAYPQNPRDGKSSLLFAHYSRYHTDHTEISFQNNGVEYSLFDRTEDKQRHAGVSVAVQGQEKQIPCLSHITSSLEALKAVLPCDPDNALNSGACP